MIAEVATALKLRLNT